MLRCDPGALASTSKVSTCDMHIHACCAEVVAQKIAKALPRPPQPRPPIE